MGEVVQFSAFRQREVVVKDSGNRDSLVPVELGVGVRERASCLAKISAYGVTAIQVRMINNEPSALLYLMSVGDAISLNRWILEQEDITDAEVTRRIDLIQMLENIDPALMDSLWSSLTRYDTA
ncbi:MAG: hypothetical protein WDZ76_05705 [Pseudohongiellaceae bacterium]